MTEFDEVTIGDCRLIHADCREVLPTLGKFDLLLTDPPYGIGEILGRPTGGATRWAKHFSEGAPSWDTKTVDDEISAAVQMATLAIVWGGQFYALPVGRCWLAWNKIIRNWSSSEMELAWTNIDRANKAFDYSHGQLAAEGKHFHPTQKPLPLMAWCLDQVPTAKSVLDPFMGSGTTGVACAQSGRSFTGIERERKYFDIACERISRAYAQGKLFAPEIVKPQQAEITA